jgi:hypothetical protein
MLFDIVAFLAVVLFLYPLFLGGYVMSPFVLHAGVRFVLRYRRTRGV